jgi:hypothetical protein
MIQRQSDAHSSYMMQSDALSFQQARFTVEQTSIPFAVVGNGESSL